MPGGLFDDVGDPLEEVAFKHAVERINSNLAASNNVGTTLSSKIERIQPGSSFFANDTSKSINLYSQAYINTYKSHNI